MATKQVRNCRVGDIVRLRSGEPRIITETHICRIPHEPYAITFGLLDENPRKNFRVESYRACDRLEYLGTQEALF